MGHDRAPPRPCFICLDGFPWASALGDPEGLRALVAVATFGSYRAAARQLETSPRTVRRRVAALGDFLGQELVAARPTRLTIAGELAAERGRLVLWALARLTSGASAPGA